MPVLAGGYRAPAPQWPAAGCRGPRIRGAAQALFPAALYHAGWLLAGCRETDAAPRLLRGMGSQRGDAEGAPSRGGLAGSPVGRGIRAPVQEASHRPGRCHSPGERSLGDGPEPAGLAAPPGTTTYPSAVSSTKPVVKCSNHSLIAP